MSYPLSELIPVMREAGTLLREHFEGKHLFAEDQGPLGEGPVTLKGDHELLLGVDMMSQKLLVDAVRQLHPDYGVYSEEMMNWGEFRTDGRMKFVIDPLDGTHNYHFGIPLWGIAVSLIDGQNHPKAGLISIPMLDLLVAADDRETLLHYKGDVIRARSSQREALDKALVAYDNQFYRLGAEAMDIYRKLTSRAFTTRITGSAAFDTAMVTLGKFDARIWNKVEVYDIAAAFPIIRGAGGVVCGFDGRDSVEIFDGKIAVCGNRPFADRLTSLLGGARAG